MANPIYFEKEHRWKMRVQIDNVEYVFSSSKPGQTGKREVLRKYRAFVDGESRTSTLTSTVWERFINSMIVKLGEDSPSLKQYQTIGKIYILPTIGNKKIDKLRKDDLQNIIDSAKPHDKRTKVLSKRYLIAIRNTIQRFWNWAYENEYCEKFKGELYVPAGHPTIGKEILQPNDIQRLFEPSDEWYWRALCFMLLCGLRPSELLGIKWEDVYLEKGFIEIKRGITATGKVSDGKTVNARRTIPLTSITTKILREQKLMTAALKSEWVFCSNVGAVGSQSTLTNCYARLKKERDLPGSLYSFRHTFISIVASTTTMSEYAIRQLVGHTQSGGMDTLGTYGHEVDGTMKETADLLDLTFRKISEK